MSSMGDPVEERFPKAIVVASGPSAGSVPWSVLKFPPDVAVITIKRSILSVPQATHWITIDHNRCGDILTKRRQGVRYYAGLPGNYTGPRKGIVMLDRITGRLKKGGAAGLSRRKDAIHAGNSGYAGLGLAYHFEAKKIVLLGIDGGDGYFCDPGPNRTGPRSLQHIKELFESAEPQLRLGGVEVVNGSPQSIVTCFPRMAPLEAIRWLLADEVSNTASVENPRGNPSENPRGNPNESTEVCT